MLPVLLSLTQKTAMNFYFSGLQYSKDVDTLVDLRIPYLLFDWFDAPKILPILERRQFFILDSGAYHCFKKGISLDIDRYIDYAIALYESNSQLLWVAAPDVLGDWRQSRQNFERVSNVNLPWLPIWQWGDDRSYLADLTRDYAIVGVGGLVRLFRALTYGNPQEKRHAQTIADDLLAVCAAHPGQLHLFGLCHIPSFNKFKQYAASADSSVWLRGRKYYQQIFRHSRTGKLSIAPARSLQNYYPDLNCNNGHEIIRFNAIALNDFCN